MSRESWRAEFMPVDAAEACESDREALLHAKRKWSGLRHDAIQRHGGTRSGHRIEFNDGTEFIDGSSCTLCHMYVNSRKVICFGCPLFKVRGVPCDHHFYDESPYGELETHGNPEPMISLIDQAIAALDEEK